MDADALSRIPWVKRYDKIIDESAMKAIISAGTVTSRSNTAIEFSSVLHSNQEVNLMAGKVIPNKMTNEEWVDEQMSDPIICELCKHLLDKMLHQRKGKRGDSEALKKLLKHQNQLILRNNLVYQKVKSTNIGNSMIQFILPSKFRD